MSEKARVLAEKRLTEMEVKLGRTKLKLAEAESLNLVHVGKSGFVSHTKHTAEATNMDLFHS